VPLIRPKDFPDHHDAELVLKLYDLRREASMREARALINRDFWPAGPDDVLAVLKPDHPLNTAFRQTSTYWEMAYGMARLGVIHPDFLLETNGHEGLFLYARVDPFLAEAREAARTPRMMLSAEWIARESAVGREMLERFRGRVAAEMARRKGEA
jgi:hypothetical protein